MMMMIIAQFTIPCGMFADAYLVALTRISGIVGGVLVMLLLSVVILPKSASHEVTQLEPHMTLLSLSVPQAMCCCGRCA